MHIKQHKPFFALLFFILMFPGFFALAQEGYSQLDFKRDSLIETWTHVLPEDASSIETEAITSPVKFGLTFGTGMSFGSGFGTSWGNYFAPSIDYRLTDRINIRASTILFNNQIMQGHTNFSGDLYTGVPSMASGAIMVTGDYELNDRITLFGAVLRNFYTNQTNLLNELTSPFSSNAYLMGFDYKISRNVSFGVQFRYQDHFNSMNYFMFPEHYRNSPFYRNYNP